MATLSAICDTADGILRPAKDFADIDLSLYSLLTAACGVLVAHRHLTGLLPLLTWMMCKRPLVEASSPHAKSSSNTSSCTADKGLGQPSSKKACTGRHDVDASTTGTDLSQGRPSLLSLPWVQDLISHQGFSVALDKATGLVPGGGFFPLDHLFCALAASGQVQDLLVLLRAAPPQEADNTSSQQRVDQLSTGLGQQQEQQAGQQEQAACEPSAGQQHLPAAPPQAEVQQQQQGQGSAPPAPHPGASSPPPPLQVVAAFQVGKLVAGHAGIVHGGLTAAMIDETFGYLLYSGRAAKVLDFTAVLTAHLGVDYLAPVPTNSTVVITARIKRIEGRKLFLEAELSDQPLVKSGEATETKGGAASTIQTCGKVYARGNALFIIPRQGGSSDAVLAAGVAAAKAGAPAGASVTLWQQPEASKSQPNH